MKIQVASDLHLELIHKNFPGERLIDYGHGAELLILAGDIANGAIVPELFRDWPVPVIYLAGNHEYYNHLLPGMRENIRSECKKHDIVFLDNDAFIIGGTRILGATLWTDYRLPRLNRTQSQLMEYVATRLNDHFMIRSGRDAFTPADALKLHEESRAWLEQELTKPWGGKTVVVTHHGCHPLSVHPRYIGNPLNAAFISEMSYLMPGVDLWIHGHVHDSFDYHVGQCRVIANPAGYILNRRVEDPAEFQLENPTFDRRMVVEV